jgi:hypothetical protein
MHTRVFPQPLMNEHQTWRGRRCSSSSQNQHFESSVSQIKLAQSYGRGREGERRRRSFILLFLVLKLEEWEEMSGREERVNPQPAPRLGAARSSSQRAAERPCTIDVWVQPTSKCCKAHANAESTVHACKTGPALQQQESSLPVEQGGRSPRMHATLVHRREASAKLRSLCSVKRACRKYSMFFCCEN